MLCILVFPTADVRASHIRLGIGAKVSNKRVFLCVRMQLTTCCIFQGSQNICQRGLPGAFGIRLAESAGALRAHKKSKELMDIIITHKKSKPGAQI